MLNGLRQTYGLSRQEGLAGLQASPRMVSTSSKYSSKESSGRNKPENFLWVWAKRLKLSSPEDIVQYDESYSKWRQGFADNDEAVLILYVACTQLHQQLGIGALVIFYLSSAARSHSLRMECNGKGSGGLAAAMFGRSGFYERYGPRVCCLLGAVSYATGFSIASIAVNIHSLPLLYLGYGVFGGIAMGVAYVPAVAVLLRWFPNDKGFASGLAVMGYGAGGLVATPTCQMLLQKFSSIPTYYGDKENAVTVIKDGILYAAELNEKGDLVATSTQVVYAGATELATFATDLSPGFYIVNSGSTGSLRSKEQNNLYPTHHGIRLPTSWSTGIGETFLCLGIGYGLIIATGALNFKFPSRIVVDSEINYKNRNVLPSGQFRENHTEKNSSVLPSEALKTPQFWIIWLGVGLNSSAAYSIIASGKTMMLETFGSILPHIVTTSFAGWYVAMISASNLTGRLLFSSLSDKIGRKLTFHILWGSCVPLYLFIPMSIHWLVDTVFILKFGINTTCVKFPNCMGATAATFPAYIADLFGPKYVAAIHGQVLSVLIPAGFLGPFVVSTLREKALTAAVQDLASKIPSEVFEEAFGKPQSELQELMNAKVVTINRLMDLLPAGTVDPSIFIYDETMTCH
eukprot:jgi/Bigna1/91332/estExt_fgenesh1_pg.C_970004